MSVAAMLAFNYFFLPPVGKFTIADPQNWVALVAFLGTSLVASQLATRVRYEAESAQRRGREVERLYSFSQQLLVEGNVIQLLNAIPNHIVEIFEVGAAALFLLNKNKFYRSGSGAAHLDDEELRNAANREEPILDARAQSQLRSHSHRSAAARQHRHFRTDPFAQDARSAGHAGRDRGRTRARR